MPDNLIILVYFFEFVEHLALEPHIIFIGCLQLSYSISFEMNLHQHEAIPYRIILSFMDEYFNTTIVSILTFICLLPHLKTFEYRLLLFVHSSLSDQIIISL